MGSVVKDPYFIVKDEVQESLTSVRAKLSQWQSLPKNSLDRKTLQAEMDDDCQSLLYMVNEIDKSIDAAEKNPQRFKLTQADVVDRRKWVSSTRRQIDGTVRSIADAKTASSRSEAPSTATTKLNNALSMENDRFIASEGDQQLQMMRRQDEDLDHLGHHVLRIGQLGREMGQELQTQSVMIDELEADMDSTSTRLAAAQKKMQHVLDRAGMKGQIGIIIFLIVLLVILIVFGLT